MGDQKNTLLNADVGARVTGQDIYEISDKARCALGTRLVLGDRVFRYCLNGASTLAVGKIVQAPAINTYDEDIVVPTNNVVGTKTVYLTNHTSGAVVVADQFKDGYLVVGTSTGLGSTYKIKSNTAAATNALLTLTLYDPTVTAITTGHTGCIVASPYFNTVLDAGTGMLVGVPLLAVTAAYYFWAQTWGPVGIVSAGTIVKGDDVLTNNNGTVIPDNAATVNPRVGIAMNSYDSGDAGPIFLQLCP